MKKLLFILSIVAIVTINNSCATIFGGSKHHSVTFNSEPSGAVVKDRKGNVLCITPCTAKIKPNVWINRTEGTMSHEEDSQNFYLTNKTNPLYWLNVLSFAFMPFTMGIDLITGAGLKYDNPNVFVELKPKRVGLSLVKVEKPASSQIEFGEIITEETSTRYSYTDNYIDISWFSSATVFNFTLTNKSPHSMRIIWDEVVYVDVDGIVSKMIHEGTRLADINNPQAPAIVPRGARLNSFLAPVSRIRGGALLPLFDERNRSLDNRTVSISLPLQIQNVTNEYVFTFRINWE